MQHLPILTVVQRALRQRICASCYWRPADSEALGPKVARPCQPDCTIFIHLPKLLEIADRIHEPMLAPYEHAMRELICNTTCEQSPTSGDYCAERTTVNCPLSRYATDVIDVLERVARAEDPAHAGGT